MVNSSLEKLECVRGMLSESRSHRKWPLCRSLEGNRITSYGLTALCGALRANRSLKKL